MAGVKISNLPAIVTPALTDIFPVVQSGVTYKETVTQLQSLLTLNTVSISGLQDQSYTYIADSGIADAYLGVLSPAIINYVAGQRFDLLIANTNTTASTLNINSIGVKNILREDGTSLVAGDLLAGMVASFEYNGTAFQLLNPAKRVLGTATNDNAVAGYVGQYLSNTVNQASAVALVTGTPANVTTLLLTPGDWSVDGNIQQDPNPATTQTLFTGSISLVSATQANSSIFNWSGTALTAGTVLGMATGRLRVSVAVNTTVYLVVTCNFAVNTMGAYGEIRAWRMR